jgi:hypothetical protein
MLWKERGASLFTHFRPFFCTFFLSKSPHLFSYKAFSFFQQALHSNYGKEIGEEVSSLINDLTEEAIAVLSIMENRYLV